MDREQKIEQFLKTSTSWRAAKDASGKVYYYDKKTRVTQWEKPDVLAEFERSLDGPAAPAAETQPATAAPAAADAAGTATAAVAAEKKDEQKPHFDKEIVGKYISALTPLTYSDVERSLFTADMSIFSVGDSAAATAAAAVIVEGVAAEVAAAEATPAESVSATACDVPVTQVVPKESAEAVVSSKDSILENNLISNVKVLVKHHGTSPVDMVSSLSNNYSGLPSKLKIMLEWLKLATALENQSPDQVDSVAEGALEEVLADMLKESFQSVRAEHRLLLQGAASAEGELPDCVLRFTGECAAAQRAVQSLARKYPDAVALRKWSEHIQLTTTAADAADGEQPSTGDVGAAVELLLLEGECLQPILLLLRKIIVKVFSSNGVCSDAVSKAGSESGGVDGGAAEGNALDNLLIDVCTIAGWSRALADEVAAALRGTLHSLRTSAQTSAAAVAEDKPVLQQQLLQGLAFTDEKLTAATKELQAVFSELIERLQEAAGKSLSLSDARSMQKSAQLLKKRTVLGALTVLKRCITDAGLPFRRDERVQTLLTTALQRSNAVGTTAASAAGLDSELSDDAVEDLAYMFPVALGSIMSGDDTEERSKNPLNWCYLCHPQLHRWFYELLLQRSSRKSCAQPEHVACMLSLSDTSDTLMTLIARCIKECVNSNGSSGDDSQQLAHPFHADAAACKSMWDAFQRAKTLCAELSDVLVSDTGPLVYTDYHLLLLQPIKCWSDYHR